MMSMPIRSMFISFLVETVLRGGRMPCALTAFLVENILRGGRVPCAPTAISNRNLFNQEVKP
jgi:hypothetical protein